MIHTDKQLNVTQSRIAEFKAALADLEAMKDRIDPLEYQLHKKALLTWLHRLNVEAEDYKNAMDKLDKNQ